MAGSNRYPTPSPAGSGRDNRRPRPSWGRPTPANDNKPSKPWPWIPANDNRPVPKPTDWATSRPPKVPGWDKWTRGARRFVPWFSAGTALYYMFPSAGGEIDLAAEGWTQYCNLGSPPWNGWNFSNSDPINACGFTYVPVYNLGRDITYPPLVRPNGPFIEWQRIHKLFAYPDLVERGTIIEEWARSIRGSDPRPFLPGSPEPAPKPWIFPDLPLVLPPIWEQPFVEPLAPPRPFTPPRTRPQPNPSPLPEWSSGGEPAGEWNPNPSPNGTPLPSSPTKGERERKIRRKDMPNKRWRRFLGWLISTASEVGDFLDALYDALPDDLQSDKDTMKEKFDKVFKNLDKVDMGEAVDNIWTNEVEDRYFGQGFGQMTETFEEFGLELGSLKL